MLTNLPVVWHSGESISPGYHILRSHETNFFLKSPQGMIPWQVYLPRVSYPDESISPGNHTPTSLSPQGIIPQRVYLPRVSYPDESISPGYHTPTSLSSQGIIPRWVYLPRVSYPNESISPGYHTPTSLSPRRSLMTSGNQQPFPNTIAHGQCQNSKFKIQNLLIHKGLHFAI